MYLVFDTETTGKAKNFNAPHTDIDNWPRMVQLAWQLCDGTGTALQTETMIIFPEGFDIPLDVVRIHGITTERARVEGIPLRTALDRFTDVVERAEYVIAHNVGFDTSVVLAEYARCRMPMTLDRLKHVCTMRSSTAFCGIPGPYGHKWPSLTELHHKLFGCAFEGVHDAKVDVEVCRKCFFELLRRGVL